MSNPYATHQPPKGGLYLKLDPGQTVKIRLATEPYVFQNKFIKPDGTVQWSTRYAWVIYNFDDETAQVLQLSPTTYRQIAALALDEEYGDPTKYNLKLTRNGSGTDTTYAVIASPQKTTLTTEQYEAVSKITIPSVTGLEHAVPISQLQDAKDAPKPSETPPAAPTQPKKDVVVEELDDDEPVNLDEIPF